MDGASLARVRWRLHGAWMWPSFIALTVLDGLIVHWLPTTGDAESAVGGWLLGLFLSLLGIVVVAPLLGRALRRFRTDMPKVVARDYAGTAVVLLVTASLLTAGLIHHSRVASDNRALQDAVARALGFIGDRAPAAFRDNLGSSSTYAIEPGSIYRTCVRSRAGTRTYCVVVRRKLPFARSVSFAGYEPNATLTQGAW
jgi:hypothetical protein